MDCVHHPPQAQNQNLTPQQRVEEFSGEKLIVSSHKLFCKACCEELNHSTIQNHVRSVKHVEGQEKMAKKEAREQDIVVALKAHNTKEHLVEEHLQYQSETRFVGSAVHGARQFARSTVRCSAVRFGTVRFGAVRCSCACSIALPLTVITGSHVGSPWCGSAVRFAEVH